LGKYQVMSANVGPWSREVLGREVSPQEFIASPEIQDAIFKGKFGQYAEKYGPEGAAKAWFAGEKGMNDPNRRDVLGTTVASYGDKFSKALGYAPEDKRPTDVSAQSKKGNFFDQFDSTPEGIAAPILQPAADGEPKRLVMDMTPKKPDRGAVDAGARGVAQGLTANFSDEIRGLVEASGANPDEPASVYKLISGALKYWGGDAEAKKRYEETTAREREITKAGEEQHPVASIAGNIAGAVALPIGAAANAATLPGRMAAGAGVGAALGGAAGAGEGSGAVDRISRGVTGAAIGGALGGVAPAAIEGAIRGGRAIAGPIANTYRGVRNVDDEAARRVATSIQRDIGSDPAAASRLTSGEFGASVQSGGPATIMDIGGDTTRALARSAANTSPEGRAALGRTINDRFEGQTDRVTGWLRNTFHFPDAAAQADALENVGRTVNRANYARAMRDGDRSIFSPELDRLMGSPAVVDAMRKASTSGKDRAITQGMGAMRQGVTVENGVVTFTRGPNGVPTYPNLAFWDATKREIDDAANAAARAGRNGEAGTLRDLARTLRGELDNHVPSYQQARAGAAHFFDEENALEAGQNFVGKNMTSNDARRALAHMTPQERQLFQDGFVSRFIETLNAVGDRRSILNKIAESPTAREKLNIALGRPRAEELEAGLRVEGIMDLARNAVQGNSTTARQLAELGLAGGAYGFSGGGINPFTDPSAVLNAALVYGAARGRNVVNERLSRRVAEMLVSNDPQILLRGIRTIARNQTMFNSLRSADRGIAKVSGNQAPVAPALQAAGVSRAEDQPDVPRPPGQ
ncbi:MAG: hypothetical protein WC807_21920, partial [Hyphomicrobium sp.]